MKFLQSFFLAMATIAVCGSCGNKYPDKSNAPVRVKVMEVGSVQVEEESGVSLSFSVAGTVRTMDVDEGQTVGKGQLVATVDGVDQAGARASAHAVTGEALAALRKAQDDFNRARSLHAQGVISESKYVSAQTALEAAREAVNSAAALEGISNKAADDTMTTTFQFTLS